MYCASKLSASALANQEVFEVHFWNWAAIFLVLQTSMAWHGTTWHGTTWHGMEGTGPLRMRAVHNPFVESHARAVTDAGTGASEKTHARLDRGRTASPEALFFLGAGSDAPACEACDAAAWGLSLSLSLGVSHRVSPAWQSVYEWGGV